MTSIVIIYQILILAALFVLLLVALHNTLRFPALRRGDRPRRAPSVSIMVPARNEAATIRGCIGSLLSSDYPDLEIIALDDDSSDATGTILDELARTDPRLRVLTGAPLPHGWTGKSWACHQLAAASTGELLLFVDADTRHRPEAVAAVAAFMERERIDVLSGVPYQELVTFWEKVVVPMTQFLYFCYLPNAWITGRPDPRFSAANGQMICFRREAYRRIGGHASVASAIVEDVALGRRAKERGVRLALVRATDISTCRMYGSLGEIVAGFSKNFFPGLGRSLPLLAGMIVHFILLYLLPWLFLFAGIVRGIATSEWSAVMIVPSLAQIAIGLLLRDLTQRSFSLPRFHALLHPLSVVMTIAIAVNSARVTLGRKGAEWKGRRYTS